MSLCAQVLWRDRPLRDITRRKESVAGCPEAGGDQSARPLVGECVRPNTSGVVDRIALRRVETDRLYRTGRAAGTSGKQRHHTRSPSIHVQRCSCDEFLFRGSDHADFHLEGVVGPGIQQVSG